MRSWAGDSRPVCSLDRWEGEALCKGLDKEYFFDKYEQEAEIALQVDELCLACPVRKECLEDGLSEGLTGVWGGIYLTLGKPDPNRNAHKTPEVWDRVREGLE